MGVKLCVYSFPQKTDRKPHCFPHHPTTIAIRRPFLPREQQFPKRRVLLDSNARSLSVSYAQEQVRALAGRRLQELTINC